MIRIYRKETMTEEMILNLAKELTVNIVLMIAWYREYRRVDTLMGYIMARETRHDILKEKEDTSLSVG